MLITFINIAHLLDKLPTNVVQKNFQTHLIEKYEGISKEELQFLTSIETKNKELFDYFYQDDYINEGFFKNTRIFEDKMSNNQKIQFLLNFLELKYKLVSPTTLKLIFTELGIGQDLSNNEYPDLMRTVFNKEHLNLTCWKDRAIFKNFLQGKENIFDIDSDMPIDEKERIAREEQEKENLNVMFPDVSKKSKLVINAEKQISNKEAVTGEKMSAALDF